MRASVAGNVAPDPDVLVLIAQEIRQRVEDALAVADEHVARSRLEQAVAQQRRRAAARTGSRSAPSLPALRIASSRDVAVRVVHQRDEQRLEILVRDRRPAPARRRGVRQPSRGACLRPAARWLRMAALTSSGFELEARATAAVTTRRGSRSSRCGRIIPAACSPRDGRERSHGSGTDLRRVVLQHPLDPGRPPLAQLGRGALDDAQRPRAHVRRLVIEEQRVTSCRLFSDSSMSIA